MKVRFVGVKGDDLVKIRTHPLDGSPPTVFWVRLSASPGMDSLKENIDLCGEADLETNESIAAGVTVNGDLVLSGGVRASNL